MKRNNSIEVSKVIHQTLNHIEVQLSNTLHTQQSDILKKTILMKKLAEAKILTSRLLVAYRWSKEGYSIESFNSIENDFSNFIKLFKSKSKASNSIAARRDAEASHTAGHKNRSKNPLLSKFTVFEFLSKGIPKEITYLNYSQMKLFIKADNIYCITLKCCNEGNDLKIKSLQINWPKKIVLEEEFLKQIILLINKFLKEKTDSLFMINKLLHRIYKIGIYVKHVMNLKQYTKTFSFSILKIENGILLKFPPLFGVKNMFYFTLQDGLITIRTNEPLYCIPESDECILEIKRTDTFDSYYLMKSKTENISMVFSDKMDYQSVLSSIRDHVYFT